MKISAQKVVQVEVKELRLYMKVRDEFASTLYDADGAAVKEYEGYVPPLMPGQHYGDYLILNIDIDTGQITNWKVPSAEQVEEFIKGDGDE